MTKGNLNLYDQLITYTKKKSLRSFHYMPPNFKTIQAKQLGPIFFTCPFNIQYLYQYQSSDNSLQNMCTQYVIS